MFEIFPRLMKYLSRPVSRYFGDPLNWGPGVPKLPVEWGRGPHSTGSLGTPGPQFTGLIGTPS